MNSLKYCNFLYARLRVLEFYFVNLQWCIYGSNLAADCDTVKVLLRHWPCIAAVVILFCLQPTD